MYFFIKLFILIFSINKTNNEGCSKEEPISYGEYNCVKRFCTKEEFENKVCIFKNSIAEIQWLNNINTFMTNIFDFAFLRMSNNDIFFFSLSSVDENHLYIYGLKSNGEKYYNDGNGHDYLVVNFDFSDNEKLNIVNIKIEDKEYPLIYCLKKCRIIDLENGAVYSNNITNFFKDIDPNDSGFTKIPLNFPIINLNQENKMLFIILFGIENLVFNFGITNILSKNFSDYQPLESVYNGTQIKPGSFLQRLNCFITKKKFVECLFYESELYKVAIFGENYNYIDTIILDDNKINENKIIFRHNSNCIHLKEEIGIFTYYNGINGGTTIGLILEINELIFNGTNYLFKPLYEKKQIFLTLDSNSFSDQNDINMDSVDLKHLMKINDNKFAYIYDYFTEESSDEYYIVLIIFDIYGNNNEKLLIKYYNINHSYILGYNPYFFYQINIISFNSFLGIAFISFYINEDNDEQEYNTYYIIIGQSEQNINEIEFNINGTLIWKISQSFTVNIDNNLFGYELKYKILSIEDSLENITIFSVNKNLFLSKNDTIDYDDSLLFNFTNINIKVEEHPIIEIAALIIEPDYNKSIEICDKFDFFGGDPFMLYEQKIIDKKILKVKFNFECYITCETCEYFGLDITKQKCLSCKNSDSFCLMKNEGNCYDINALPSHYNYYSFSENSNQLICISIDEIDNTDDTEAESNENEITEESDETENNDEETESDEKDETDITVNTDEANKSDEIDKTYNTDENYKNDESDEIHHSENSSEKEKNSDNYIKEFSYDDIINKVIIVSNNPENYTKVIDILYNKIKEGSLDEVINKEIIINGVNITIQATTTYNQKYYIDNNINTNFSIIDLTECENKMGFEKPIIILKMDISNNASFSPQVEYLLINPYTYEKIDLSICENSKIDIYIPFNISKNHLDLFNFVKSQGYNIFNSSDSFYKDICTPFDSENNTDVLIKDRKKDYFINEYAFCEEGCEFSDINMNLNKVKCNCEIKKEIKTDTKFSSSKVFENFYKIDSYSNFKIIICYYLIFTKEGLLRNYCFYILSGIILSFIVISVINLITSTKKVNEILESILEKQAKLIEMKNNNQNNNKIKLFDEKNNNEKNKKKKFNKINYKIKRKKNKKIKKAKSLKINQVISINNIKLNNENIYPSENRDINQEYNINHCPKKQKLGKNLENYDKSEKGLVKPKIEISTFQTEIEKNEEVVNFIIKNIEKEKRKNYFNNEELNSLEYKYALEIDDRTYIQYYWSLLKLKHLIIFTFISNDDYNIFLLKLGFFLISFSLYWAVNAMFFSDDSIHRQYKDKGKYNYLYQIPKILYSTIISAIINMLLKKLSLSQKDISKIKHNLDINKIKKSSENTKRCLKIKFIIFIIIGFILLLFFWYYLSCFCSVFVNSQIALINDTIISYGLTMLYPFGLNLLPGLLRIPSLKKGDKKILYIISLILAII